MSLAAAREEIRRAPGAILIGGTFARAGREESRGENSRRRRRRVTMTATGADTGRDDAP